MAPIIRPKLKEATSRFHITLPTRQRDWAARLGQRMRPRVGAAAVIRDALLIYQAILRILVPGNRSAPDIEQTIETVCAALKKYLEAQRAGEEQADDHPDAR